MELNDIIDINKNNFMLFKLSKDDSHNLILDNEGLVKVELYYYFKNHGYESNHHTTLISIINKLIDFINKSTNANIIRRLDDEIKWEFTCSYNNYSSEIEEYYISEPMRYIKYNYYMDKLLAYNILKYEVKFIKENYTIYNDDRYKVNSLINDLNFFHIDELAKLIDKNKLKTLSED